MHLSWIRLIRKQISNWPSQSHKYRLMNTGGTSTVPALSNPVTSLFARQSDDAAIAHVLAVAEKHNTQPFCSSFGPFHRSSSSNRFAYCAFITAQDASGNLQACWVSEKRFHTSEEAVEHAEGYVYPDNDIWYHNGCSWE